jgi:hypothetical protein
MLLPARWNVSEFGRGFWLVLIVSLAAATLGRFAQENCRGAAKQQPTARPPASTPEVPSDASKQLLAEFERTYAVADGKVIKRVAPPFSPGRLEFYRVHHVEQAKSAPEGPEIMYFRWDVPKPNPLPTNWPRYHQGRISGGGMAWLGGHGASLAWLIEVVTQIHSWEMEGDRKLKQSHIAGDWVIRDGVPPEKMLTGLEALLREECKLPLRLRLTEKDRQIIVASGKFQYRPRPGRGTVQEDRWYGYEGNDLQDYDQLEIFGPGLAGLREEGSGDVAQLLAYLTFLADRPVVGEGIELPADMRPVKSSVVRHLLSWQTGDARLRDAVEKGSLDVPAMLKRLSEQTGLTFTEKPRRLRVLLIERVDLDFVSRPFRESNKAPCGP